MSTAVSPLTRDTKVIFDYWTKVMHKGSATKFTTGRKNKVLARLKSGYQVSDIKLAIDGCKSSAFHQGQNKDGTVYDCLTLICRSDEKIDQFIGYAKIKNQREAELDIWESDMGDYIDGTCRHED